MKSRKVTLNIILNREYNESQKGLLDILRIKGLRYSTTTLSSGNSVESPCIQKLDSNEYLVLEKVFLESDTLDRNTIFNYYHPCIVGKFMFLQMETFLRAANYLKTVTVSEILTKTKFLQLFLI